MFRFDNHTFDTDTGELIGPRASIRLQPKPARLLAMLLEAGGELVEREQIRATLWPATNVDFDAGLNTCMRQIRAALRESGGEGKIDGEAKSGGEMESGGGTENGGEAEYIETLPKRGYRITVAVSSVVVVDRPALAQPEPAIPAPAAATGPGAWMPYAATFVVLAIGTAVVLWGELFGYPGATSGAAMAKEGELVEAARAAPGTEPPSSSAPARLAVVPFVDPGSDANAAFNRDLTEAFVTALVSAAPDDIVVIGPSTTGRHFTDNASLPDVAAAVNADFVLHGGYRSSADIFFVEVVLPDGAHLYAQRMDLDLNTRATAPAEVIAAMTASMLEALGR